MRITRILEMTIDDLFKMHLEHRELASHVLVEWLSRQLKAVCEIKIHLDIQSMPIPIKHLCQQFQTLYTMRVKVLAAEGKGTVTMAHYRNPDGTRNDDVGLLLIVRKGKLPTFDIAPISQYPKEFQENLQRQRETEDFLKEKKQ
jgi:hypothetical protein